MNSDDYSVPKHFVNWCSDVTGACEAARALVTSTVVSVDKATAAAGPAYDKMEKSLVRADLCLPSVCF